MVSSFGGSTPGVIAVVGAMGRQGSSVTRHLLKDGWQVRALTRNPSGEAAQALRALGAEVRQADTEDPASIVAAFTGAHGVYNVQNPEKGGTDAEIRQGGNVAEAAAETGIRHVVHASAGVSEHETGVGYWDSKVVVAQRFRNLGLPLTVLRPMAFMELMTDKGYYPQVSTWHLMPKLMGPSTTIGWLCLEDLGAIAARVFADPDRWIGTELGLLSDVRSIGELRALWKERTGRNPRRFPMPEWLFKRIVGDELLTMWRWLGSEQFDRSMDATREVLPEALTVQQWLARQSL
jgi:uncharacterized protein YbjT (DUF2867 family)